MSQVHDRGRARSVARGPITMRQVQRFAELLCDLGFDEALSGSGERAATSERDALAGRPVSMADEAEAQRAPVSESAGVVRIDVGRLFREIGYKGAEGRLVSILFGVEEAEVDLADYDDEEVGAALANFFSRFFGHIEQLSSCAAGWL